MTREEIDTELETLMKALRDRGASIEDISGALSGALFKTRVASFLNE
jgi:hypothetical protein